jgi:nitrite reductase/ring-hydroxylating ferredoxin subunit
LFIHASASAYIRIMARPQFLLALAVPMAMAACKKENNAGVPPVAMDISINVNLPEYVDLQVPGGWVYLTGGSQGLIVYRVNNDEFTALDRHCPVQPENLCHVVVDESQVVARDTACCTASFLIQDGQPLSVSGISLRKYNTTFNGTTLRIYN